MNIRIISALLIIVIILIIVSIVFYQYYNKDELKPIRIESETNCSNISRDFGLFHLTDKNNKTTTATVFEPELKLEDNMFNPPEGLKWMTMEEMMK